MRKRPIWLPAPMPEPEKLAVEASRSSPTRLLFLSLAPLIGIQFSNYTVYKKPLFALKCNA
jgi:hypothetical protein